MSSRRLDRSQQTSRLNSWLCPLTETREGQKFKRKPLIKRVGEIHFGRHLRRLGTPRLQIRDLLGTQTSWIYYWLFLCAKTSSLTSVEIWWRTKFLEHNWFPNANYSSTATSFVIAVTHLGKNRHLWGIPRKTIPIAMWNAPETAILAWEEQIVAVVPSCQT